MSLAKVLAFFEGAFHPNASVAAHVPEGAWSDLAADAAGQDGPAAEAIAAAVVTPSAGGNVHVQLEKIDEYVRSSVPEFRQAHRDLSKDLSTLSKDIALVERSIQAQINNVSGVKLR